MMPDIMTPQLLTCFGDVPEFYPCWAERKIDGHRCLIHVDDHGRGRAYSRNGNPLPAGQVLADRIATAAAPGIYDGEIAAETWSATQSSVKRHDPAGLAFYAFDALLPGEWTTGRSDAPIEARRGRLGALLGLADIHVVEAVLVTTDDELGAHFDAAVAALWEGIVCKAVASPYHCAERVPWWVKLKAAPRDQW